VIQRLWTLYRFEVRKLAARRLPLLAALAILLVALLAPQVGHVVDTAAALSRGEGAAESEFANGWTALSGAVKPARFFLVLVLLVLAASTVAEETGHGTIKALLTRPVGRTQLLLAKALATWSFAALVLVLAVAAAALSAELARGLYDVVDPVYPDRLKHAFGDMSGYLYVVTAVTLAPLLALTTLGLLASVLFEHAGHATGVAIGVLFFLSAFSGLADDAGAWVFVPYLAAPFDLFDDLANQYTGARRELWATVPRAALVPLAWSAALFAVAAVVLERRDITAR